MSGYNVNITGESEVYHIYAKDRCLYNCLNKKEFKKRWKELNAIVGLMKTDYTEEDLSYERVDAGIGQGGGTIKWEDPEGSDSY